MKTETQEKSPPCANQNTNEFCIAVVDVFRKEASDGSYYDTETFIAKTEDELVHQVAIRCRAKWEINYGFPPLPVNDRDAVTTYFAAKKSSETYNELLNMQKFPKRHKRDYYETEMSNWTGLWYKGKVNKKLLSKIS